MSWLARLIHREKDQAPPSAPPPERVADLAVEPAEHPATDPAELLISAAQVGDAAKVEQLVASEAEFDPAFLGMVLRLANHGSRHNADQNTIIARLLIDAGADVDFQEEEFGETLLLSAVKSSHHELITLLISAGADPTLTARYGDSPLKWASESRAANLLAELDKARPRSPNAETLIIAAKYGAGEIARQALESGVDCNSKAVIDPPKGQYSATPALLLAAEGGHPEIVRLLLDHGASPNTTSEGGGETALTAAICGRSREAVAMLIEAGADLNLRRGFDNGTPMGVANWIGEFEIARLLKEAGATE